MKTEILKLRNDGKSYSQIVKELGCSKSTVSFHCGDGQKNKTRIRTSKHRAKNNLVNRVFLFRNKKVKDASRDFQRRTGNKNEKQQNTNSFKDQDVLEKFGQKTVCYLSGDKIDLLTDNYYCFDHIIPATKGGSNEIDNLGILHKVVNKMKSDLTVEEFLFWCNKICDYQRKVK